MRRLATHRAARACAAAGLAVTVTVAPTPAAAADEVRDLQWHLGYLGVTEAHRHSQGEGVTVAVLDTGVDADHSDLIGAVLPGVDLTAMGGADGHTDLTGHGTGMAGLIAARGHGPASGALGIAPRSTILPVRVRAISGAGSHTAEGIDWATRNGARVICIASAGDPDPDLLAAIRAAHKADVVIVAAAGNLPDDSRVRWPAAYPGVIAAAGIDRQGNHAPVSVTGPEVDLAAPAVDIVSTDRGGGYGKGTGTSDATAIIAGAAALVRARYPGLSAEQVVHRLTATATDKGPPGRDDQYGYGVLDLVKALTADLAPLPGPTEAATRSPTPAAAAPVDRGPAGLPPGLLVASVAMLGLLAVATVWHRRQHR